MSMFTLAISYLTTSNLPWFIGSYTVLFFTALGFTSITCHIHNWALCFLWLHLFILSGADLGSSSFSVIYFCLFILFMAFLSQEYWSGLPFPSPVDHILSELSTMTYPSWVALHGMALCFTELEKILIYVISLISFLWLWFSFCLFFDW